MMINPQEARKKALIWKESADDIRIKMKNLNLISLALNFILKSLIQEEGLISFN